MLKILLFLKRFRLITFNHKFRSVPLKLNLGCGRDYKEGWINIDNNKNIKKLDIRWNLANGIPFKDSSIDFIFNEHFLEHLNVKEGQIFLKDCKRVLKKGGVLRISMPDLEISMKEYFNPNWKEENKEAFEKYNLTFIKTRAERINIAFRNWGHKWLYDREELERRLKEAGFKDIKFCEKGKSAYPELDGLETRTQSLLIAECVK